MTKKRTILQLGRYGDVINVLPIAWEHWKRTGERPHFVIAREFADLLDGVTYVDPFVYEGPFTEVLLAAYRARNLVERAEDLHFCQIYGRGLVAPQKCTSFAREAWAQGGSPRPWGSSPPVFDNRDPFREEVLRQQILGDAGADARPVVLLALEGTSSPFPFRNALRAFLDRQYGHAFRFVDISRVRAPRFYDMIGLFERANGLITIDTGHLHLAAAVPDFPVVTLVTRDPSHWHGSPWRRQHVARLYYDEFPRLLEDPGTWQQWLRRFVIGKHPGPRLAHVWADWREPDGDARRRRDVARASWALEKTAATWIDAEFRREHAARTGRDLGDPHDLHFIRDAVEHAVAEAIRSAPSMREAAETIVVLTNGDTCFAPGLTGLIVDHVRRNGSAFAHRYDFDRLDAPFVHESPLRHGKFYPGTDLLAFPVRWWREHGPRLGDYVAGREHWDEAFRQLVKHTGGRGIDHAIYHEKHPSFWDRPENRTVAGNEHNRREREKWFEATGFVPEDFRYFSCVERNQCP